jgi:hypothetical protein
MARVPEPYEGRGGYFAGQGGVDPVTGSLHEVRPVFDSGQESYDWDNLDRQTVHSSVTAHFGDLTTRAAQFIRESEALVGCVAWLTDFNLLDALVGRPVALIVQKEDFLRPDGSEDGNAWKRTLRRKYAALSGGFERHDFPVPLSSASYAGDATLDPIRCVGNHNSARSPAMPRMHHKFLVRLEPFVEDAHGYYATRYRPVAVWTGSFNFSRNAGLSFENATVIESTEIAGAYLDEFSRIATLSEPLDWESDWVYPEWRIGT